MLNNLLNLEGVAVLSKQQQSAINGGQVCKFTTSSPDGSESEVHYFGGYAEGSAGSSQANDACVSYLAGTDASSCHYDCAYDGFGQ